MLPEARTDRLVVEEVEDELLVFDRARLKAHRLNPMAALVWRHCDGRTSVTDFAGLLHAELGVPNDEELVWLTLARLEKAHLLLNRILRPEHVVAISRRKVIEKLGLVGTLQLLLPVVTSIAVPAPASAQSAAAPCGVVGDRPHEVCAVLGVSCTTPSGANGICCTIIVPVTRTSTCECLQVSNCPGL